VLAQFVVGFHELVEALIMRWVQEGSGGEVQAKLLGAGADSVRIAQDSEVCEALAKNDMGCFQNAIIVAFWEHNVFLVGLGSF